ncbi:MAG: hypothetical protein ACP5D7_21225 [Limnospira sp.]
MGDDASPFRVDFDGDEDLDLIAGSRGSGDDSQTLHYFQNTGTQFSPSFSKPTGSAIAAIAAVGDSTEIRAGSQIMALLTGVTSGAITEEVFTVFEA